jgi:hypothetical protein
MTAVSTSTVTGLALSTTRFKASLLVVVSGTPAPAFLSHHLNYMPHGHAAPAPTSASLVDAAALSDQVVDPTNSTNMQRSGVSSLVTQLDGSIAQTFGSGLGSGDVWYTAGALDSSGVLISGSVSNSLLAYEVTT